MLDEQHFMCDAVLEMFVSILRSLLLPLSKFQLRHRWSGSMQAVRCSERLVYVSWYVAI